MKISIDEMKDTYIMMSDGENIFHIEEGGMT